MPPRQWTAGTRVTVVAPASAANLGPGFDSVGLALGVLDRLTATVVDHGLHIEVDGRSTGVPRDETHLVWRAMSAAWERVGHADPPGMQLTCTNNVPHSRGLGSSATAIVLGVGAALALIGCDLRSPQVLELVGDVAAGLEGHPDNSSASVYGGLTLSWSQDGFWRTARLRVHPLVEPVVLVPRSTLPTSDARRVLPATVTLRDAAANSGSAALLVHALTTEPALLLPATREWLHQEQRRSAYPDSMGVVDRLRAAGVAAVISGAGPSVLVLARREQVAGLPAAPTGWTVLRPGIAATGLRVVSPPEAKTV